MRIKKVKINDKGVNIDYLKEATLGGFDSMTMESKEMPAPEFSLCLQQLKP